MRGNNSVKCYVIHRMTFTDFHENFQRMEICYLGPDSMIPEQEEDRWECKLMEGAWKRNVNAGGCRNYPSKNRKLSKRLLAKQTSYICSW